MTEQPYPQPDGWIPAPVPIETDSRAEISSCSSAHRLLESEALRWRLAATVTHLARMYAASPIPV